MQGYNILYHLLAILGSIGLFLFGMKLMSEALQRVAGEGIRRIVGSITSNPFRGLLSGTLVTGIIQSSSATTVMIVSFINAGILSLKGSVGLIFGANIGTTVTPWLSVLGFSGLNTSWIALSTIGICLPLLFSKKNTYNSTGEFFVGFGILLIGLEFIKNNVPNIEQNPELIAFVANYTDKGLISILLFIAFGTIVTMILQSSSVTVALTFVISVKGWINYEQGAAIVLGNNIGTTITANLAAIVANQTAKRSARIHTLFNVVGNIWMVIVLIPFLHFIDMLVVRASGSGPYTDIMRIPVALAIFHSAFNIINSFLLIGFVDFLIKLSKFFIWGRDKENDEFKLKYIESGLMSTPEISILQARREIVNYAIKVKMMYNLIPEMLVQKNEKKYQRLIEKAEAAELLSDSMERDIADYLTKVNEKDISPEASHRVRSMLKIIDDIESLADVCYHMAMTIKTKNDEKIWFTPEMRNNLNEILSLIDPAIRVMITNLESDYRHFDADKPREYEEQINKLRDRLKAANLEDLKQQAYPIKAGEYYNELVNLCEKAGDYIINVTEAISEN